MASLVASAAMHCSKQMDELWHDGDDFAKLVSAVRAQSPTARVVMFGGAVRDAIHAAAHREPVLHRDIDVVLGQDPPSSASRTHFGGFRLHLPSGRTVDYWALARTYAFQLGLFEPSFENLLKTTVYRINSCFYDMDARSICQLGAVADIQARRIAFNCTGYLHVYPEFQSYRALDYSARLHYQLSDEVASFVQRTVRAIAFDAYCERVHIHRPHVSRDRIAALVAGLEALRPSSA